MRESLVVDFAAVDPPALLVSNPLKIRWDRGRRELRMNKDDLKPLGRDAAYAAYPHESEAEEILESWRR